MECLKCKAINLDENKFCGACGTPLDLNTGDARAFSDAELRAKIQAELSQLRDQRVVEIETAAAIVERVSGWAKVFAFFVGIPLALLVIVLGGLGVKTFSDFSRMVTDAKAEVSDKLKRT